MSDKKRVSANRMLILGAVCIIYIVLELFLYPYAEKMTAAMYIPYDCYFAISIRAAGLLAVMLFLVNFFRQKGMSLEGGKKVFLAAGIGIYVLFYVIFILYFTIGWWPPLGQLAYGIASKGSWMFCIPALLTALGAQ